MNFDHGYELYDLENLQSHMHVASKFCFCGNLQMASAKCLIASSPHQGVCHSRSAEEHARIERIVAVSNLMLAINSAFNFIIYMLRNELYKNRSSRKTDFQ